MRTEKNQADHVTRMSPAILSFSSYQDYLTLSICINDLIHPLNKSRGDFLLLVMMLLTYCRINAMLSRAL